MGLFDFVKEAGAGLFSDEKEQDLSAPIPQQEIDDARRDAIEKRIAGLGIEVTGLAVSVEGSTAKLEGRVLNQECCEKVTLAAGNQGGIATVDCCLEVENPEPEATFYTVVAGDTLGAIAKQHLGSASKYTAIFEANKPLLSDPDKIYPGQVLRIPV